MLSSNEFRLPNMSDSDPDQLFVCPFDKVHRISAMRFPYHIMKCRKNHRGVKVHFCPFNARHIVPVSELRHHVANCPDRSTIEPDLAYAQTQNGTDGSYMKGDTSVPSYHHDYQPSSSENWDIDDSRQSRAYHQLDEPDMPDRIHNLVGMTRAQKKEFHRKLLEVHKQNGADTNSEEEPMQPEPARGEMRRPKQLPKAAAILDQRQYTPQIGILNSVGHSVPHGPIGLGRAMLVPSSRGAMPRPGTTVQGRSIAANIFNSHDAKQESRRITKTQEASETGPRCAPTVAMASANVLPPEPSPAQSELSKNPLPGHMPNMAGLGRGLGIPRGGYRPGLGMPAVGLQSRNQTPGYPGMQQ